MPDNTVRTISIRDLDALLEALCGVLQSVKTTLLEDPLSKRFAELDSEQKQRHANTAFGKKGGAQMSEIGSVSIPYAICHPLDFLFPDAMAAQSVLLTPVHVGMPWSSEPYEGFRIATWSDGGWTEYTDIVSGETLRESGEDEFTPIGILPAHKTDIPGLRIEQQVTSLRRLVTETCKAYPIDRNPNATEMDDESLDALEAEIARDLGTA